MTKSTSRRLITSALLLMSAVSVAAAQRILADISGTWAVSAQSPTGASESTAVFKQDGAVLSGTLDIPDLGSAKIAGTVKGDTVKFSFSIDVQGTLIPVQVSGMLKDKDSMAGTIFLPAEMGNYPYTAKRKP